MFFALYWPKLVRYWSPQLTEVEGYLEAYHQLQGKRDQFDAQPLRLKAVFLELKF